MKLSAQTARDLQPGAELRDHVVEGLQLRATTTGKSWHVYYRVAGQRRRPKIGTFPALSLEAARDAARTMLADVAKGRDPSAERAELRRAPTVDGLLDYYLREYAEREYKPETLAQARRVVARVRLNLGNRRVADVTRDEVNAMLDAISSNSGAVMANRVRMYLSKAFSLAEDPNGALKWREPHTNPCRGARHNRERRRRRHIKPHEFAALHAALQDLNTQFPAQVAAIYVMLFVGSRVTELAKARRDELVLCEDGTARLEPAEHKTADYTDRVIHVPRQAADILKRLPPHASGYLFGELGTHAAPRHSIFRVWAMARERAGCADIQPRDLRRTFASVAKTRGASLDAIGELLSHKSTETTKGYAYLFADTATELAQRTGDAVQGLLEGRKS